MGDRGSLIVCFGSGAVIANDHSGNNLKYRFKPLFQCSLQREHPLSFCIAV